MGDVQLHLVLPIVSLLAAAVAIALAIVDHHRTPAAGDWWFVASMVAFTAAAIPFEPFGFDYLATDHAWAWRIPVALVVALPALLLHLVAAVTGSDRSRSIVACDALTVVLVAWLLLMPTLPGPEVSDPAWWYTVALGTFLLQFLATIVLSVRTLVRASRGATGTARTRGRLLAATLAAFGFAYTIWFSFPSPTVELVMSAAALVSGLILWLAIRGPRRTYDLFHDHLDPYRAIEGLVATSDVRAELPDVLDTIATEWGLVALAAIDVDGMPIEVVGSCSVRPGAARTSSPVRVRATNAEVGIEAWTSPLTPPLRMRDLEHLTMLAHLIDLALAREDTTRRQQAVDVASQDVEQRLLIAHEQLRQAKLVRERAGRAIAGDMRGPIQALLGLSDALETRWTDLPPEQLEPLQGLVARQVARLAAVVDKLLVVSSIEDGTLRSTPEVVDVRQLVESVLESGIDAQVSYECSTTANCCDVHAEPVALREIVTQLLDNAASHGSPNVLVHVAQAEDEVLLEVVDHGQGVREEFVPELFDRFTRDSPKVERGLGIGLAIVKELVATLGGSSGYRRDEFERSVFWVRLPHASAAAAA